MRKSFAAFAAVLLLFAGCRHNAVPTVEGRVVDATIHSVTLLTPAGDSLCVSTLGTDPMLVPGVLPGDEIRIAYELLPEGEMMRALTLDITTPSAYRLLPGIWRDCSTADEVGLVLAEDGSARAAGLSETLQDWSLDGDQLVLTATDPDSKDKNATRTLLFRIERLDVDSLIVSPLQEGARRLAFGRQ